MNRDEFKSLVEEANLAPSVHNTQPTRWQLSEDGTVHVFEDRTRRLPVGDPAGRDAGVSHGAAIEGFALACAAKGWAVSLTPLRDTSNKKLNAVASLALTEGDPPAPLRQFVRTRRTYRGAFAKTAQSSSADALVAEEDVCLVRAQDGIARLAQLNDEASLRTFRDKAYRAELLSWMRLSRSHPNWAIDGLNAEAMEMSSVEAAGAGFVLKPGIFETLDRLGVARLFVAEAPVVRSAQAIVLFHRPEGEDPLMTGRRFYRLWLQFTRLGLSAAPMAVLADDVETRAIIANEFQIPSGRRLITTFRLGVPPQRNLGPKPRLPVPALLV